MKLVLNIILLIVGFSGRGQDVFNNRTYFELLPSGKFNIASQLDHIVFQDSLLLIRIRCPKNNFDKIDTMLKCVLIKSNDTISIIEVSLGMIAKATLKRDTLTFFMGLPLFPNGCSYVKRSLKQNQLLSEDIQTIESDDRPPLPHSRYLLVGPYRLQNNRSIRRFTNGDLEFQLLLSGSFIATFCDKVAFKGTYKTKGTGFILSQEHFKFQLLKDNELYYITRFD